MFCSNCGKSIRPEDTSCPHCGAVLGEDRFQGNMYTSSQVRLPVDALDRAPAGSLSAYTRTDYMSYDNQPEENIYSNTTYRPLLNDEEDLSLQEQAEDAVDEQPLDEAGEEPAEGEDGDFGPEDADSAPEEEIEDAAEETADAWKQPEDEDNPDDDDEESVSPLPEIAPRAISPAVQRYMREAEQRHHDQAQRSGGGLKLRLPFWKKAQPEPEDEEEPAEDIPGVEAAEPTAVVEDAEDIYEEAPAEDEYEPEAQDAAVPDEADDAAPTDRYEDDAYEDEAYEDEAYEPEPDGEETDGDEERASSGFKLNLEGIKNNRTLKIVLAVALVLVVLIGGVRWLLYVTSNLGTKIAGVTHSTYSEGIKLINSFSTDEYRSNLVQTGSVNMEYAQRQMNEDMGKLNALMPDEPQENDQLFVTTLTILHEGIQNVIKADAQALYNGTTAAREAESQQEWAAVQNAVKQLNEATSVTQLSALAGDVQVAVIPTATPVPTPVPTPEPTAMVLREGLKDNSEVERMQRRLIELGYLEKGADGDFGPKTTSALKAFQTAAGLAVDGVATEEVLNALYAETAPAANATEGEGAAPETQEGAAPSPITLQV